MVTSKRKQRGFWNNVPKLWNGARPILVLPRKTCRRQRKNCVMGFDVIAQVCDSPNISKVLCGIFNVWMAPRNNFIGLFAVSWRYWGSIWIKEKNVNTEKLAENSELSCCVSRGPPLVCTYTKHGDHNTRSYMTDWAVHSIVTLQPPTAQWNSGCTLSKINIMEKIFSRSVFNQIE